MQKFEIHGGKRLAGTIRISGAKNAALPILMTSLLTDQTSHFSNIPVLDDVKTTLKLIEGFGSNISPLVNNQVKITPCGMAATNTSDTLVQSMRASILAMGPILAKSGEVKIALPGGCAIGARPVDLHINAMQQLGAKIVVADGYLNASAKQGLVGATIKMEKVSVGATENAVMAATLASGKSVIENAAKEPELIDLVNCLNAMGARINGAGTDCITIHGVRRLSGANHRVLPDRIETGTYLVAVVVTGGHVLVQDTDPQLLVSVLSKLEECGAQIKTGDDWIALDMKGKRPIAVDIETAPYPGFPTDLQAQFTALNSIAIGSSKIVETIFENRFMHVPELNRMGANITVSDNVATCHGVNKLSANDIMASDLRASASLVIAGLMAAGTTSVDRISHADRGYENLEIKLKGVGADINRIEFQDALSA